MRGLLFTGITFGVFMTEAILHYNMGMSKADGKFRLRLPPPEELVKIAAVTGAFSLASSVLIRSIEQRLLK